ncbi:MAG: right-handed parallel beta-helix repeat-containing protein, partial [Pseudomonadota bacterium]
EAIAFEQDVSHPPHIHCGKGLTISNNNCLSIDGQPSFSWIVVKPYGPGHYINGFNVQGNVFRTSNTRVTRAERIDTTFATMDMWRMRNILFEGNCFNGVDEVTRNPHINVHSQNSPDATWTVDTEAFLPFGGYTRTIDALVPVQAIRNGSGQAVFAQPYVDPVNGSNTHEFRIIWPEPVEGDIRYSVRMDDPS